MTTSWWLSLVLLISMYSARAVFSSSSLVCDHGWVAYNRSCYRIFHNHRLIWEDAKKFCRDTGGHLVRIDSSDENAFLFNSTRLFNQGFWIGLNDLELEGDFVWEFLSEQPVAYESWFGKEDRDCVQLFGSVWREIRCTYTAAYICEKEAAFSTSPPVCDHGWVAHNRSCYRIFYNHVMWEAAKKFCRDTGGHLVRIDTSDENAFLFNSTRSLHEGFWIGLNDLEREGDFVWEFLSEQPVTYESWYRHDYEDCVQLLPYHGSVWGEIRCTSKDGYICEKEEGKNACPDGWIPHGDKCYQFNMGPFQKMTWNEANYACKSTSNFASLVGITSQNEQDFITKRIQDFFTNTNVWIGLNDLKNEGIFRWSSNKYILTNTSYQNWANEEPLENNEKRDCVMMLGLRHDGAWTIQDCSLIQNFICTRNRDISFCNVPLGMEDRSIQDQQITASSSLSAMNGPEKARIGHNSSWCPASADQKEYLQVDLLSPYDIRGIILKGEVTEYTLRTSNGKGYKEQGRWNEHYFYYPIIPMRPDLSGMVHLYSVTARFVQIFPKKWKSYPCFSVEFIGCPAKAECTGKDWEHAPGNLCYQINMNHVSWEEARSVCLDEDGDLLSVRNLAEKMTIVDRLSKIRESYVTGFWISLNDKDYRDFFYWSDDNANTLMSWGSGSPERTDYQTERNPNGRACVFMNSKGKWKDEYCDSRLPFICMKRIHSVISKDVVRTGFTGVWMSSAKYYWPLSAIDNNIVIGTSVGKVNGKVTVTSGVKASPNSALKFSGEGSYVDFGKFEKECFSFVDNCTNGFTLSFMASFDSHAVMWSKRVNILDSETDETRFTGLVVYVQYNYLWFVVSKTSMYVKTSVRISGDNTWHHYVMRWNGSNIHISVDGQPIFTRRLAHQRNHMEEKSKHFIIGIPSKSAIKYGEVNLAMVAFWEEYISNDDINLIYKTEFGSCPFSWQEYGASCYQFDMPNKDFKSATVECQRSGGELVSIDSNVEQGFMNVQVKYESWIGVFSTEVNRTGEYVLKQFTKDTVGYSNWFREEQEFDHFGSTCTKIIVGGHWQMAYCLGKLPYICEKQKELNVKAVNTPSITKCSIGNYHRLLTMWCPAGLVINITAAFWGSPEKNYCSSQHSIKECGFQEIPTTTSSLKKKCDQIRTCDVVASEYEPFLTDPCPGKRKYLEVNYSCVIRQEKCRKGWSFFDGACYHLFNTPRKWKDARMECRYSGAELVSISSPLEQSFATSLMERAWYLNVWTGLNDLKTKGVYEWSDDSLVSWTNWYYGQPDERRTDESCVYMGLERSKQGWMYWSDQNCTSKYPFMCKYITVPKQAQKLRLTKGNFYSCNGKRWKGSDNLDSCYSLISSGSSSWLDALAYCKRKRSTLVTIRSKEENEFLRNLTTRNVWIGMESRGVFRGHVWEDGEPVSYINWDVGQPDSYNGLEACVEMNAVTGRWSDALCSARKNYFCKRKKGRDFWYRPTYATPGSSLCKDGWTLYKGMCYVVGNDTTLDMWTWHEAEKKCQNLNGHLASINNEDEQKFIQYLAQTAHSKYNAYWIGLNDVNSEGSFQWSDYSTLFYANWAKGEPNDGELQEDCVAFSEPHQGHWIDLPCQLKSSYICKSYNESYRPPPTPTPTRPPTVYRRYCASGWIAHGRHCYQFHTDPSEYKTWINARDACREELYSSSQVDLVSILNMFEQAFIMSHLNGAKQPLWIGLNNRHKSGKYIWVDGKSSNFFNWNTRRRTSNFGHYQCVEMDHSRWVTGEWSPVDCSKLNGYICKSAASYTFPKTMSERKLEEINRCPKGYKAFDDSCYKFVNSPSPFDEARKACKRENADVMTVDTNIKQAVLVYMLERYIGNVWIGFVHQPNSVFKFVDHRLTTYTNWGPGQPNRLLGERSCTQANVTGSDLGVWDDVDCTTENPFVCEIYKGEPKVTIPLDAHCPNGWLGHDKYCYKHIDVGKTWAEAKFVCARLGANLVSIHDISEEDFLMFLYRGKEFTFVWTGLSDREFKQRYQWCDRSPLVYINWKSNFPKLFPGDESCVKMHTKTGLWETASCDTRLQYTCKRKLECSSVLSLNSAMVTVTDSYKNHGADKAILTDEKTLDSTWCTNNTSGTAGIKVEFNELVRITSISFQGRDSYDNLLDLHKLFYVKSFRISYRRNGRWWPYHEDGHVATILGYQHDAAISTKTFKHPITLDGLSVTPVTWFGELICMKIRLHGCPYVCQKQLSFDFPNKIKENAVSSTKDPKKNLKQVAIDGQPWCAKTNDKKQWIQFYFNNATNVSQLITAGDKKESFVKTYSIQYSLDGKTWINYKQYGMKRIFQGNYDSLHAMKHSLISPIKVLYLRITPITWNRNICMRISILGCKAAAPPKTQKPTTDIFYSTDEKYEEKSSGLPSGSVAGLVVGILLFLALVVAILVFLFFKKRARSEQNEYPVSYSKAMLTDAGNEI